MKNREEKKNRLKRTAKSMKIFENFAFLKFSKAEIKWTRNRGRTEERRDKNFQLIYTKFRIRCVAQ